MTILSHKVLLSMAIMIALSFLTQSFEPLIAQRSVKQEPAKAEREVHDLVKAICNSCSKPVRFKVYKKKYEGPMIISSEDPSPTTVEYRVKVIGPPEAVALIRKGEITSLYQLAELLDNKDRGWAAFILLAQMTSNDSRVVSVNEKKWWIEEGQTGREKKRWSGFLNAAGKDLYWNSQESYFMYRETIDHFAPSF